MYKIASIVSFPAGADKSTSYREWADQHERLATAGGSSGLVRCTLSRVLGPLPREADVQQVYSPATESLFDGYASYWFTDRAAFEQTTTSSEWTDARRPGELTAPVTEATIIEGPSEPYKVVWIVRFRPELVPAEAHYYWEHTHGPIVADAGISRYVQSHVTGSIDPTDASAPSFDGFSECWFPDEQAFVDALATPHWGRLHEDRHQIFDMPRMWSAALTEHVVVG